MQLIQSYDTSVFIEASIHGGIQNPGHHRQFWWWRFCFCFLGSLRATLVPAVTVPVSLIATFAVLSIMDFTINLLTLLAMILAIGMVVDDAIVVLENIFRRIQLGEPLLLAALKGDTPGRLCRDCHNPGARGGFRADYLYAGQYRSSLFGVRHRVGRRCLHLEFGCTDPVSDDVLPDIETTTFGNFCETVPG